MTELWKAVLWLSESCNSGLRPERVNELAWPLLNHLETYTQTCCDLADTQRQIHKHTHTTNTHAVASHTLSVRHTHTHIGHGL